FAQQQRANSLRNLSRFTEAEGEYKASIQFFEKELGPQNHDTLSAYYHFAYALALQGRTKEAQEIARRVADTAAVIFATGSPLLQKYNAFFKQLGEDGA